MKENIKKIAYLFIVLYAVLILNLVYVQYIKAGYLSKHPANPRQKENINQRGTIYDRNGKPLAVSKNNKRLYPEGEKLVHIVGYLNSRFGKVGIENYQERELSVKEKGFLTRIINQWKGHLSKGNDVYLTIDSDLQKEAYDALDGRKGAVVVINPQTGEILALASSPSFNPNKMEKNWGKISKDKSAPALNRCLNGQYPPGSTFKIITTTAALEEGFDPQTKFYCQGVYKTSTYTIQCAGKTAHGNIDLPTAVEKSCNIYFAQLIMKIKALPLDKIVNSFGFSDKFDTFPLPISANNFPDLKKPMPDSILTQTAIGEGEILATPLMMAMITSALANEGRMMRPTLIYQIRNDYGKEVFSFKPKLWRWVVSKRIANQVKEMMTRVVSSGTGWRSRINGVQVAGKTGSAENPHGKTHAWFVCFAPADNPKVAIAVILENSGYGGEFAAPAAKKVLQKALQP